MKLFYSTFSICLLLSLLVSCSIETETHFNKDFSGSQLVSVDMAEFMSMAAMMGEEGAEMAKMYNDPELADSMAALGKQFQELFQNTGASNVNISMTEEGVIKSGFEFADIETFAKMEEKGKENNESEYGSLFTAMPGAFPKRVGKTLTFDLMNTEMVTYLMAPEEGEAEDEETQEMMQSIMGESVRFKNTYTFDGKIASVKCALPIVRDDNKIVVEYSLADASRWTAENKSGELMVTFK